VLPVPGSVAKGKVAVQFVEELRRAVLAYDEDRGPDDAVRLRVALSAGEFSPGESQPVTVARELAGSPVIRRVLAAETRGPLAVIASPGWYDAFIRAGHAAAEGYREVWVSAGTYRGTAWVRVPGRSRPAGLTPADNPAAGGSGIGGASAADGSGDVGASLAGPGGNMVQGGSHGTVIQGGIINGGVNIGNVYGASRRERDGGR
jgi:hypothetical protein